MPLEDLKKEAKREQQFEEGRYEYIFARPVKESLINSIPNVIEKTDAGMNGGVVLSLPLMPDMLPSYDLRPYKLPPEAYVKLTLAQLSDVDKGLFLSELQKKSDDSALDVGMFVQDYLSGKTVSTEYFFGKLRTIDFGQIFKNYAQNKDVETLTFEVKEEKKKPIKSKVTFEDAENFLIEMITS